MSLAYRCISWSLALPLRAFALLRFVYHHLPAERAGELWGRATRERPEGTLLWIHAVDIGEMRLALTLSQAILESRPDLWILITSMTPDAALFLHQTQQAEENEAQRTRILHQYTPLDRSRWAQRFLKHWSPDLAIRIEAEFWPNTIRETAKVCQLVLVQGRMSKRSFRMWSAMPRFAKSMMSRFALVLCQNQESARYLSALGAEQVQCSGNLKLANAPQRKAQNHPLLAPLLSRRPLWIAASTYPREEQAVLYAHRKLRARYPQALCVLAPRLIARGASVAAFAERCGERTALRSQNAVCSDDCTLYVLDTLGELDAIYPSAGATFVGGSLVPKGGHNLLEPALHGCIVLHGYHTQNVQEAAHILKQHGSGFCVRSSEELANKLLEILSEIMGKHLDANGKTHALLRAARGAQQFLLAERARTLERVLQSLAPYLPATPSSP